MTKTLVFLLSDASKIQKLTNLSDHVDYFATGLLCTPFLEHEAQATLVKVKLIGL